MTSKSILYISIMFFFIDCTSGSDTNSDSKSDLAKTYKLKVDPESGSKYQYDISNETIMNLEVDGKEIESINRSAMSSNYAISKDSTGTILLTLKFDKIKIYSKTGDKVKEMNSDNNYSIDPSEKLLSILKETTFQSTLDTTGNVKIISGPNEISDKIITAFPATNQATKDALESQWNKSIGEQFVKQNTSQVFQLFPDTLVHVGSVWKSSTTQQGQLPIAVENLFTLKSINAGIAVIKCLGTISNTNEPANISGIGNNVKANLEGEQQCEYEIETKTGMVINSHVKAKFQGTVEVMGRTIPIKVKASVNVNGKRNPY